MPDPHLPTRWTMVAQAAGGDAGARTAFTATYLDAVRAVLVRRWRGGPGLAWVDDAVQEVFVDLFRRDGALARLAPARCARFRSFLFGVIDVVARRFEQAPARQRRPEVELDALPVDVDSLSRAFDRAWARSVLLRAAERQRAAARCDRTRRWIDLLELRFRDGLPIRDIAARFGLPAATVHRDYAAAREEFKRCLGAELISHFSCPAGATEQRARELLALLQ